MKFIINETGKHEELSIGETTKEELEVGPADPGERTHTMKNFEINGTEYTVEPCTAICLEDGLNESKRQNALFVEKITEYGEEKWQAVVFNCWQIDNLNSNADFQEMCADSSAWESDWEVLETVRRVG